MVVRLRRRSESWIFGKRSWLLLVALATTMMTNHHRHRLNLVRGFQTTAVVHVGRDRAVSNEEECRRPGSSLILIARRNRKIPRRDRRVVRPPSLSSSTSLLLFPHRKNNNYSAYWPTTSTTRTLLRLADTSRRAIRTTPADGNDDDDNDHDLTTKFTGEDQRRLNNEFGRIAVPALIQLTAEPLAGLVDTAYLGRYGGGGAAGAAVLGGAGVAISALYAVSKLYNDPLLRTSISLVASANDDGDDRSKAVSSALFLAGVVGVVQMVIYVAFRRSILTGMGVSINTDMYKSAIGYLTVRAYGTPAATLWLVTNGIFRGLGDTNTPLYYSLFFTVLNAILDPIFIFTLNYGAAGAAAGTTIAQYVALVPLVLALHRKVPIRVTSRADIVSSLKQYVSAGTKVLIRTIAKVGCYGYCARQAALLGPIMAASYNLTFQLGFAVTQICESIAIAVQTLMAREFGKVSQPSDGTNNDNNLATANRIRHLIRTSIWSGGSVAVGLSMVTYWRRNALLTSLTTNVDIQTAAASIFPVVLLTQIAKGFCYPINGILMGGLDWSYTMIVMWLANAACCGVLLFPRATTLISLRRIWWGLCAFMIAQAVLGVARFQTRTGPWKILRNRSYR